MRILVTGMNGTVGGRVAEVAAARGHEAVAWDRSAAPPDHDDAVAGTLAGVSPDAVIHLAMGPESWAAHLAGYSRDRGIPFLFTSTASVFAMRPDGPYTIESPRTATDDYGAYKIRCEDAVWSAHPGAMVVRLGYQIDLNGRGNNMVAHLDQQQAASGSVLASTRWVPACSFLPDTAAALAGLVEQPMPGLLHLDANAADALSYVQIVTALAGLLHRDWSVVPTTDRVQDGRLLGGEALVPSIRARLALA